VPDDFDRRFYDLLGPAAANALAEWAMIMGLGLRLNRVFVNGRSTATVLAVFERSPGKQARKVILKHDTVADDGVASAEYVRHREAMSDARGFRGHLTELVHEPIRVGDGSWISIQEVAGDGLDETHLLTALLAAVPGVNLPGIQTESVICDRDSFVNTCSTVVTQMLTAWAGSPDLEHPPMSVVLRRHLADRVAPGKSLADLARRWPGASVSLDREARPLPNPFAFVFDPPPDLDVEVPVIIGKGHGDMHPENILVRPDLGDFWLIDLSRYQPDAPLTQDPVQLVLSIVNRTIEGLTDEQRETLLDVLTAPVTREQWTQLPGWLAGLIQSIEDVCRTWVASSRLGDEWRRATVLSTLACALIFAARPSTSTTNRAWFVRLAARCAAAFATTVDPTGPGCTPPVPVVRAPSATTTPQPVPDTGLAELCACLGHLRRQAIMKERSGEVERLVSRARHGHDIWADFEELAFDLDVLPEGTRSGQLPGVRTGQAVAGEVFRCPLTPACGRTDRRQPGSAEPFCHVGSMTMTRTVRSA
jgi:hypothetical protein